MLAQRIEGGVAGKGDGDLLKQLAQQAYCKEASDVFLSVWKEAVSVAGSPYFGVSHVDAVWRATSIQALVPDVSRINDDLASLDVGDAAFLLALYQFHNPSDAQALMTRLGAGTWLDLLQCLDLPRRQLMAKLVLHFSGW